MGLLEANDDGARVDDLPLEMAAIRFVGVFLDVDYFH
jgi:hypothetical protein